VTDEDVGGILTQARRYWVAGLQDASPTIRFMHLSYSKALLDALIFMADRNRIAKIMATRSDFPAGHNFDKFFREVAGPQDKTAQILFKRVG
jgi:hypothetical protein